LLHGARTRGLFDAVRTPVIVIAAGKAAIPMAASFVRQTSVSVIHGMATGPLVGDWRLPHGFEWYAGGHPDPNDASAEAGGRALDMARLAGPDRLLVILLSGGASALLASPAPGLRLSDKTGTARALMAAGVPIDGLNCVRKHLSALKGGRLGAEAWQSLTLAISDVHGPVPDDPSVIGSGPTVCDPTTFEQALDIVRQANAETGAPTRVPPAVISHLERGARGELPETIKPHDARLSRARFEVIGNRETALEGARRAAERMGYAVAVLPEPTEGEARVAGPAFLERAVELAGTTSGSFCALAAGETTVRVTGKGRGGRNQEFALAVVPRLPLLERVVAVASAGTDGIDGPTDAAGAVVDPQTLARGERAGLDWAGSLAANDAYNYFEPLGGLIKWGPTGTNVGDLHIFLKA
jgi:hydroxypyruvate reductase